MGRIWANLEFELSQILESCSVWNQAGEGIESRQRQQQVAEKQLQLFLLVELQLWSRLQTKPI